MSTNPCDYKDYLGGDHQTADQGCIMVVLLQVKPWVWVLTAAYRLYARSVCDTKAPLQLQYAACSCTGYRDKCYVPLFLPSP